jgi:hypothetical protein
MSYFRHMRPLMLGAFVFAGSASAATAAIPAVPDQPPACVRFLRPTSTADEKLGAAPMTYANGMPIGMNPDNSIKFYRGCAPFRYNSRVKPYGFATGQTNTVRFNLKSQTHGALREPIVNGRLSPSQRLLVKRFLGRYVASDNALWSGVAGQVLVRLKTHGRLAMTSTMDITGSDCHAVIGPARRLRAFPAIGADAAVDVQFILRKGNCPWISGRYVTLHYNRALTGADIYQVEVSLRSAERGQEGEGTQTWDLNKLQPAVTTPAVLSSFARRPTPRLD